VELTEGYDSALPPLLGLGTPVRPAWGGGSVAVGGFPARRI
jgi:hypothetical protein